LVRQEYKFTEGRQDYRTGSEITYGGRGAPIDIGKSKDNYDKDEKPRCFNYNIYRHIVKNFRKLKKEKKTKKYYMCDKVGYFAKNCRSGQKMKVRSIQDDLDNEDKENNNKEKDFVRGLE